MFKLLYSSSHKFGPVKIKDIKKRIEKAGEQLNDDYYLKVDSHQIELFRDMTDKEKKAHENDEKQTRYEYYLELKKEFDNQNE